MCFTERSEVHIGMTQSAHSDYVFIRTDIKADENRSQRTRVGCLLILLRRNHHYFVVSLFREVSCMLYVALGNTQPVNISSALTYDLH